MDIWVDSLRYYTPIINNVVIMYFAAYLQNGYVFVFILHVLGKLIDRIVPLDDKRVEEKEYAQKDAHIAYSIPLVLSVFSDTAQFICILNCLCNEGNINMVGAQSGLNRLSFFNKIALLISASITMGNTVNVSHELIHRQSLSMQYLDLIHLMICLLDLGCACVLIGLLNFLRLQYCHYQVFHILWHHRKVGQLCDPITARYGETLYVYLRRQIVDCYKVSWRCEAERVGDQLLKNRMIWYTLAQVGVFVGVYHYFNGIIGVALYTFCVMLAVVIAEAVEYFEHYGIVIEEKNAKTVGVECAWNSVEAYTNIASFRLQRHSDHHVNSKVEYQICDLNPKAPMLPAGYHFMLQVSLNPSVFFELMHPRLTAFKANIKFGEAEKAKESSIINKFYYTQAIIHSIGLILSIFI